MFSGVLSNLEEFFDNLSSNINKFDEDEVGENEVDGKCCTLYYNLGRNTSFHIFYL